MATEALWRPQAGPQTEFCTRPEFEVLYGGAKGGGKSDVLLMEGLRQVSNPHYRAVFFRRRYTHLSDMFDRAQQRFRALGGKWNGSEYRWTFPSGAHYDFRHLESENDKYTWQGQEISYLAFDQLEQFSESQYDYLRMQVRTSNPSVRTYVRSSANPGGIGHGWVKKRFIDGKEPRRRYVRTFTMPDGTKVERDSCFIPAKVYDNKILLRADPGYLADLMDLPPDLRRAMLEGDWDIFTGQAFTEWRYDIHTIAPFTIPPEWLRFTSTDWGYNDGCATLWYAVDPDSSVYVYRERYERGVGATETGREIVALGGDERIAYRVMGVDVDQRRDDGPTIGELLRKGGLHYRTADMTAGSRIQGAQIVHDWLRVADGPDEQPTARLRVFRSCLRLIRELPALVYDSHRPEDVDDDSAPEGHADLYAALRYGLMSRPHPAAEAKPGPRHGGTYTRAELRMLYGYSDAKIDRLARDTVILLGR